MQIAAMGVIRGAERADEARGRAMPRGAMWFLAQLFDFCAQGFSSSGWILGSVGGGAGNGDGRTRRLDALNSLDVDTPGNRKGNVGIFTHFQKLFDRIAGLCLLIQSGV